MLSVVNDDGTTINGSSPIDEIVRVGARRMLAAALEAEVNANIAELAEQRDEHDRRLVVRNGYHQPRKVTTAAGVVEVKAPRVNGQRVDEETGERKRFSSAILLPWCRKSPTDARRITAESRVAHAATYGSQAALTAGFDLYAPSARTP